MSRIPWGTKWDSVGKRWNSDRVSGIGCFLIRRGRCAAGQNLAPGARSPRSASPLGASKGRGFFVTCNRCCGGAVASVVFWWVHALCLPCSPWRWIRPITTPGVRHTPKAPCQIHLSPHAPLVCRATHAFGYAWLFFQFLVQHTLRLVTGARQLTRFVPPHWVEAGGIGRKWPRIKSF